MGTLFNIATGETTITDDGEAPPVYAPTADDVRAQRDRLLAASDWTQLPDAPTDAAAWAVYRQALRDVTAQDGFPEQVQWPDAPGGDA